MQLDKSINLSLTEIEPVASSLAHSTTKETSVIEIQNQESPKVEESASSNVSLIMQKLYEEEEVRESITVKRQVRRIILFFP